MGLIKTVTVSGPPFWNGTKCCYLVQLPGQLIVCTVVGVDRSTKLYRQVTAEKKSGWSDANYVSEAENRFALMNNSQLFQFRGVG